MRIPTVIFFVFAAIGRADAQVGCTAGVSAGVLSFGSYVPVSPVGIAVNLGDLEVSCTNFGAVDQTANFSFTISAGQSGSAAQRQMSAAGAPTALLYNLYEDAAYTVVWPDSLPGIDGALLVPASQTAVYRRPLYGRIPGSQTTVSPGAYSDTLVFTVQY